MFRGAGVPTDKMSCGIVLQSNDGGKTWSPLYDLGIRARARFSEIEVSYSE
jgi:hypothetical protein